MHSIAPGIITYWGSFPITNTMLAAVLSSVTLITFALVIRKNLNIIPGKLQTFYELIHEYFYNLTVEISDKKRAEKFYPYVLAFFLFILISNYWGLIPIFGESITVTDALTHHYIPLFRGATGDTNTTFALSIVSFILVVGYGLMTHNPIGLLKHYMQYDSLQGLKGKAMKIAMSPIFLFVGILELLLEPLKSISLSFRLFGNIFAGETLVTSMTILNGIAIPLVAAPFLLLEVLVGAIQALVFSLLTLVFLSIITSKHH